MKSFWEIPFIVVDIETSGSHQLKNGITEIACVTAIGGEIVDVYSTLINPRESIPVFISKMTGITDEMVSRAPLIEEIIPKISELFSRQDAVFVAHNARFDWSFISESFIKSRIEIPKIPRLCTLKLSRRLLPKKVKKNLGELAEYFKVQVKDRHRAFGDAAATAHVLNDMLEIAEKEHQIYTPEQLLFYQNKQIRNFKASKECIERLNPKVDKLPDEPGVYKFLDSTNKILYAGKSDMLKTRVASYFNRELMTSKRTKELLKRTYDIEFETTGSFLSTILLEADIIRKLKPPYNSKKELKSKRPFIKLVKSDAFPYPEISFNNLDMNSIYYGPFKNTSLAFKYMRTIENKFKLRKCSGELKPSKDTTPCVFYDINKCDAPCAEKIDSAAYSSEVTRAEKFLSQYTNSAAEQLENQFLNISNKLDKKKNDNLKQQISELKELFDNKYGSNHTTEVNALFLHPLPNHERLIEVLIFNNGRLHHNEIIGTKAPLDKLFDIISELINDSNSENQNIIDENISDLELLKSYCTRHHTTGDFLYLSNKSVDSIKKELTDLIINYSF